MSAHGTDGEYMEGTYNLEIEKDITIIYDGNKGTDIKDIKFLNK